jgi:hypothetical protein
VILLVAVLYDRCLNGWSDVESDSKDNKIFVPLVGSLSRPMGNLPRHFLFTLNREFDAFHLVQAVRGALVSS